MSKRLFPSFVAIFFALTISQSVQAWDAGGHEIVAWVAMDHLNPKAKARLDELTKKLKGPWPFNPINVACWMDVLKGNHPGMPYLGLYKPWHYIDFGLKDTDPLPALVPGGDNEQSGNAVVAFQRILVVLKGGTDPYIPAPEIAVAMSMHIVGDIHQPLHASTEYYMGPDGKLTTDRGGNRVAILNSPVDKKGDHLNLHAFWDGAWRLIWDDSTSQVSLDSTYDDPGTRAPAG
jgi:hypothetical protein